MPAVVDVDAVVAAVVACPSVAHLVHGGQGEQIATFLPGRRVRGIRVTDEAVEVHIATRWDAPIHEAAVEVRNAIAPFAGGRPVTVAVDDVDDPQAALSAASDRPPLELEAPGGTGGTPTALPPASPGTPSASQTTRPDSPALPSASSGTLPDAAPSPSSVGGE